MRMRVILRAAQNLSGDVCYSFMQWVFTPDLPDKTELASCSQCLQILFRELIKKMVPTGTLAATGIVPTRTTLCVFII